MDRFNGDDDALTTNTYLTHPNEMPSTSTLFPVQTNQPELSTNEIDHSESICRDNGFSVCTSCKRIYMKQKCEEKKKENNNAIG